MRQLQRRGAMRHVPGFDPGCRRDNCGDAARPERGPEAFFYEKRAWATILYKSPFLELTNRKSIFILNF